ncbi:hypothetical protein CPB83DRAFT_839097 [Crepidotus variabilis]|uniref:Uncharacterized protein n=1 Tax=Crepidotus variabilis TaxID=179855 RepID=A0A9P6E889_9AGAR|nr:hypothetical protein CPB83DRAFT_839097 [Crepidotus variabilis]
MAKTLGSPENLQVVAMLKKANTNSDFNYHLLEMQAFSQSLDSASIAAELAKTHDISVPSAHVNRNSPTAAYHIASTEKARILYKVYQSATTSAEKVSTSSLKKEASASFAVSSKIAQTSIASRLVKKEEDVDDNTTLLNSMKKEETESVTDLPEEYAINTAKWNMLSWTGRVDALLSVTVKVRNKERVESTCFVRHSDSRLMMLAGLFQFNPNDPIPLRFCTISTEKPVYTLREIESKKKEDAEPEGSPRKKTKGKGKKAAANMPPGYLSKKLKLPGCQDLARYFEPCFEYKHKQLLSPRIDQDAPLVWYEIESGKRSSHPTWIKPVYDPDQSVESESSDGDEEDSEDSE